MVFHCMYVCATFCLSIHPLMDCWVVSTSWLLWVMLLWTSAQFSSVQSLSRVRLFATPWIAARQASLSITISGSSLRLTSIEFVMPSSHLILGRPLLLLPPISPSFPYCSWGSQGKNTEVACHSLLQWSTGMLMLVWAREWRGSNKRSSYELAAGTQLVKTRGDYTCVFI